MMGFGTLLGDLDIFKAQCFAVIANEIGEMRDKDMKDSAAKMRSKSRR